MKYISSSNIIIISPEFNDVFTSEHIEILSKHNKVIFSDYILNDKLFEAYENKTKGSPVATIASTLFSLRYFRA